MNQLLSKITARSARIGVIGLGYVGLPLAVEFAERGFPVTGFDVDRYKIEQLQQRRNYIQDVDDAVLARQVAAGRLQGTEDFSRIRDMDCVSICVPTPLRKTKDPDLSYIIAAVQQVREYLHPGMLIVLESTTYPGTTDELILPEITSPEYRIGENMFLAFSPERVDPGNPVFKTHNTPKVIGGTTPRCAEIAHALYSQIIDQVVLVSSTRAAEMVKLLENTFRAVNIGLVNEMAVMCERLDVNVWEVIDAAATKPFGFMKFYPGPGLGGHCIPIDPHYLSWKLKTLNYNARFIELAGDINSHMPDFLVQKLGQALNQQRKCYNGSRILLLGIAYKRDVNDLRESPALDLLHLLKAQQADVCYHDPYIPGIQEHELKLKSVVLEEDIFEDTQFTEKVLLPPDPVRISLRQMDAVVVVTDHSCYESAKLIDAIGTDVVLFDARNMIKDRDLTNVYRL
ncbi:MAG: nucleotide sugar dehydrogenase [Acidobacteria bacterium]|nr:nucleotide sugar dehydrogenase [Acidobacteriota bacterium]